MPRVQFQKLELKCVDMHKLEWVMGYRTGAERHTNVGAWLRGRRIHHSNEGLDEACQYEGLGIRIRQAMDRKSGSLMILLTPLPPLLCLTTFSTRDDHNLSRAVVTPKNSCDGYIFSLLSLKRKVRLISSPACLSVCPSVCLCVPPNNF
jgi:hypothetical protein